VVKKPQQLFFTTHMCYPSIFTSFSSGSKHPHTCTGRAELAGAAHPSQTGYQSSLSHHPNATTSNCQSIQSHGVTHLLRSRPEEFETVNWNRWEAADAPPSH